MCFCSFCYVLYILPRNLLSPNLVCASRYIETALCMVQMTAIFYCALVLGKNALNDALLLVRFSRCPRKGVKTPFSWESNLELCVLFLYTLRYCRTNKKSHKYLLFLSSISQEQWSLTQTKGASGTSILHLNLHCIFDQKLLLVQYIYNKKILLLTIVSFFLRK